MALSMTKAAVNTWNLALACEASVYTIEAFNDGVSVFSVLDTGVADLGYIVGTDRGINPSTVRIKGGSTGRPASMVASSDYDFTASPGTVAWRMHHARTRLQRALLAPRKRITTPVATVRVECATPGEICISDELSLLLEEWGLPAGASS